MEIQNSHSWKCIRKCRLQNAGHLVQGGNGIKHILLNIWLHLYKNPCMTAGEEISSTGGILFLFINAYLPRHHKAPVDPVLTWIKFNPLDKLFQVQ